MQEFINVFSGGMRTDIDRAQQKPSTYTDSYNGRIVYNEGGTFAWEVAKGNKFVLDVKCDYGTNVTYKPIAAASVNGKLVLLMTNGTNSEIGMVTQDQYDNWAYQTLFNDKYDPNRDLLRFSLKHNARILGVEENNETERFYWNDDYNEPRVFNILAGASFGYLQPYPSWYSVHGMAQMPDLTWGLIKYQKNIGGTLKSGKRQYSYRYVHRTGYKSPWSAPCAHIMLTDAAVDSADWNRYTMRGSGVITTKGHQLEIKYLDQRFQRIEVACLYYATDNAVESVNIIYSGEITASNVIVPHTSDIGVEITADEIIQRYYSFKQVKAQAATQDNYLHFGNVVLTPNLTIDTSQVRVEPFLKKMISDEQGANTALPLTHQNPKTTTETFNLFTGVGNFAETYLIDNDYINYKGTQWEHLFKSNFRGETYPYAIVVFDRKGQPCYAQHISDLTYPTQHGNTYIDSRVSGSTTYSQGAVGDYKLTDYSAGSTANITDNILQGSNIVIKMLGMKMHGIDLTDILFDEYGKLQVSGFMIVRMDRVESIIAQGLLLNTTTNVTDATNLVHPLPTAYNWYYAMPSGGSLITGYALDSVTQAPPTKRNWFTFEAPDVFSDITMLANGSTADVIELTGGCFPAHRPASFEDVPIELIGSHSHFYNKNYFTGVSLWTSMSNGAIIEPGISHFGDTHNVDKLYANVRNTDNIEGVDSYREISSVREYINALSFIPLQSIQHKNAVLLKLDDYGSASLLYDNTYHCSYYIANYRRQLAQQQLTASTLENRVYYNIGHFIPINAQTVAVAHNSGTGRYVFNNIQIFGGDCYPDYFGYARLMPGYFEPDYENPGDCSLDPKPDYSIGLIFPCETKFNQTMRSGETYPRYGTRPFATYCGSDTVFPDGIYYITETDHLDEDFNINKVLQATDVINRYNSLPIRSLIEDFPLLEAHSELKIYGDEVDGWRNFKVNNIQYAQGVYGEITDLQYLPQFNSIYVLQRNSLARIRFNDRELVNTQSGTLTTGTAQGYQGHDYISSQFGTQHQFSVVNSGKAIYWMDSEKGKMLRFAQDGLALLSDSAGMRLGDKLRDYWIVPDEGTMTDGVKRFYDNPTYLGGIHGVYDYNNDSVFFTFTKRRENKHDEIVQVGKAETIEYNEQINAFVSWHGFTPDWYMQFKDEVMSFDYQSDNASFKMYLHNEGERGNIYNAFQNSWLEFLVNPSPSEVKVFDNAWLTVNGELAAARVESSTIETPIVASQTVVLNNSATDDRPMYREGMIVYPMMGADAAERERGEYAKVLLNVNNNGELVRFTAHKTRFRKSYR